MVEIEIFGQVPAQKNNKTVGNNKKTGKIFVTSNKRVKQWQKEAEEQLKEYDIKLGEGFVGIEIEIWNKDNRARDLDNQASTLLDAFVKAGIIKDDSCKYLKSLYITYMGVDRNAPRAAINFYTYYVE